MISQRFWAIQKNSQNWSNAILKFNQNCNLKKVITNLSISIKILRTKLCHYWKIKKNIFSYKLLWKLFFFLFHFSIFSSYFPSKRENLFQIISLTLYNPISGIKQQNNFAVIIIERKFSRFLKAARKKRMKKSLIEKFVHVINLVLHYFLCFLCCLIFFSLLSLHVHDCAYFYATHIAFIQSHEI